MGGKILSIGDCVLDLLCSPLPDIPSGDRQFGIQRIVASPGGNSLNFALAAAAIRGDTVFRGAIGDDMFGPLLADIIRRYPLDAELNVIKGQGTATTLAVPDLGTGRRLLTYSGANAVFDMEPQDMDLGEIVHLHRGGYWFTGKLMGERTASMLRQAREVGVETSMDPATDPQGWDRGRIEGLLPSLEHLDMLFVNEPELMALAGCSDLEEALRSLSGTMDGTVFVHMGDKGACWRGRGIGGRMGPIKVGRSENPTGCGDVFNGALVAYLTMGTDLERAVLLAQAAAALHLGDIRDPYPSRTKIERAARTGILPGTV